MRKLLLILLILALPSLCFASGVRSKQLSVTPDQLILDNPEWDGQAYAGKVVVLSGSKIAFNRNYLRSVTAYTNHSPVLVQIVSGTVGGDPWFRPGEYLGNMNPCPNLPPQYVGWIGWNAYKTYTSQKAVWKRTSSSTMPRPAEFQESGIIVNPANFEKFAYEREGYYLTKQACYSSAGTYPEWGIISNLRMSQAEYEGIFKPEIQASVYAPIFKESTGPVNDGTK